MTDPTLGERVALAFSTKHIKEAVRTLRSGRGDWSLQHERAGWHRTRPYPMGFYPDDPNLYYALGWGYHVYMWPWERWLVMRAVRGRPDLARKGMK